jgi:pyruvate dehydrogenase E1 component alpha subunit
MVPVMAGVALATKIQRKVSVSLTYLGDGAVSTGDFHEGMNFASTLRLPFVLIIENNQYAYSTPATKQAAISDLALRAKAYAVPAEVVDGNDVLEVYRATRHAIVRARTGGGPSIIEAKTMRMHGHSDADSSWYVPKEQLEQWRHRDPIEVFERQLYSGRVLDSAEKAKIEARINDELESDLQFALDSPFPEPEVALDGVYEGNSHKKAQKTQKI